LDLVKNQPEILGRQRDTPYRNKFISN